MTDDKISLPIKRLDPAVELPSYAYEGDAGLDLRANESVTLAPHERRLISTGLAIAIPEGYAGFVQPRSGLALREGLSMANTPGLVDSHYRGELKVCAVNLDDQKSITIERGELEDGYFQIRFSLRDSHWTKFFDPQGNEVRDIKDDRSGSKDPDAMTQIAYAMRASLEIPRREFVKEELERLESYLESDNTLAGVEKMKKIFEEDPATLFEAASAVVPDAVESDVDMSAVVDARGKA